MIVIDACTNWRDLSEAKEMIRVAHEINPSGLVKFQLFDADQDKGKPYYDWVKAHELNLKQAESLFNYGAKIGQEVFFSVFAPKFVDWCEAIGVKRYKIASGFCDMPTISKIQKTGKPIIQSLITSSFAVIGASEWLYCPPGYPQEELGMSRLGGESLFDGFSDHAIGIDCSKIALARMSGLTIEKHFVLKHDKIYPDNDWSMDVKDLKELVRWERMCQQVL